jgi:hypothetical protein
MARVPVKFINRGTGAGGANTNKNGLSYEQLTTLDTILVRQDKNVSYLKFDGHDIVFTKTKKSELYKYMSSINECSQTELHHPPGCKEPDEVYINESSKILYIIEKKFQQGPGSVDEKIQTGVFKRYYFQKVFPNYMVHYIYCLSDWFKRPDYGSTLEYLKESNIPFYWGSDENYKKNITEFMHSS